MCQDGISFSTTHVEANEIESLQLQVGAFMMHGPSQWWSVMQQGQTIAAATFRPDREQAGLVRASRSCVRRCLFAQPCAELITLTNTTI
jgi:hypothetical protein